MSKPVLGRGLGALLGSSPAKNPVPPAAPNPASDSSRERVERLPISKVHPSSFQPRKDFSTESIQELADSIKQQGIVQPLIVRPRGDDFELIAGERRWRAAQLAGLTEVPALVREADDRAVLEMALIENLQRENLNPIEEALGYSQLVDQFQLKQEEAAVKVGKSRSVVANALRLLRLPSEIQSYVREGRLSVGHAKVILGLNESAQQKLAAERVLRDTLNVRQTEDLVNALQNPAAPISTSASKAPAKALDVHAAALQNQLQERFGTKVRLQYRQGKGTLQVHFFSDDDLDRVLKICGVSVD
jgi:ParB family chromosome partitioning protein